MKIIISEEQLKNIIVESFDDYKQSAPRSKTIKKIHGNINKNRIGDKKATFKDVDDNEEKRLEKIRDEYKTGWELKKRNPRIYGEIILFPGLLEKIFGNQSFLPVDIIPNKKIKKDRKEYEPKGKPETEEEILIKKIKKKYPLRILLQRNGPLYKDLIKIPGFLEKLYGDNTFSRTHRMLDDDKTKIKLKNINKLEKRKKLKLGTFGTMENLEQAVSPYKTKKELERKNPLAYICVRENDLFDYFDLK